MRDYNFFSYLDGTVGKKGNSIQKWSLVALLTVALAYGLTYGATVIFKQVFIANAKNEIAANAQRYAELSAINLKLDIGSKYLSYIKAVDKDIAVIDVVDTKLIDLINSAMPERTYANSMILSGVQLKMVVTGDILTRSTQLIQNLDELGNFYNITLNNVGRADANYVFTLTADIRRVENK